MTIEFRVGDVRKLLAELPDGSGTTGMVAVGNGRDCLMFDLDERCEALARERIGLYLEELAHPQPAPPEPSPGHEQEAML